MDDKATRYLADGRVSVVLVDVDRVAAEVKGYDVAWTSVDGWTCSCLGWQFRRRCSHIAAVRRVVRLVTSEEPTTA